MAENPQKPKVIPIYQPFKQVSHLRTRHGMNIALVVIIILAAVLGSIFVTDRNNKNHEAAIARSVRLIYANPALGQISLADNTGKVLVHANLPKGSYANFEALSPDGVALVSSGSPGPYENFIVVGAEFKDLSPAAIKILRQANNLNGSAHFIFTDSRTIAFVTCDVKDSCRLVSLDLSSNTSRTVIDTGLRYQSFVAYSYLLGKSDDGKSVYLRVKGQNKISKNNDVIYRIELASSKVLKTITIPKNAGYDLSLSPDGKRLVYATTELVNKTIQTTLHIRNVSDGKETTVNWNKSGIADATNSLKWSPDSLKVLLRTATIHVAPGTKTAPRPITMAYLDVAGKQVVELQTISDTGRSDIGSYGWLDNDSIVYDLLTFGKSTNPTSTTYQTYKQDIGTKTTSQMGVAKATLLQAAF